MNSKERLSNTFSHKPVDRKPCICPGGMMNMITTDLMKKAGVMWPAAHTDAEMMAELAIASHESRCFDNIGVPFCMTVEAEALGAEVTMGSEVFEPHVTGYPIETVEDWTKLSKPDLDSGRSKVTIDAIRIIRSREPEAPIIGNLTGPVSVASSVMEPVTFYKELRKKKAAAHEFMTFVTEGLIDFARAMVEAGADVIAISDPSGTGEILGPKFFEEYAVRYLNMLLDGLKDLQMMGTIVHICGNMTNVYDKINMVDASALSFDSVVPMNEAREKLQGRVLMGNVSTYTLEFGKPEDVKRLTRFCSRGGSDILSPACGLGTRSPLSNIQAIMEALEEDSRDAEVDNA